MLEALLPLEGTSSLQSSPEAGEPRKITENHGLSSLINQICSLLVKFLSAPKPSEGRSCCSSSS